MFYVGICPLPRSTLRTHRSMSLSVRWLSAGRTQVCRNILNAMLSQTSQKCAQTQHHRVSNSAGTHCLPAEAGNRNYLIHSLRTEKMFTHSGQCPPEASPIWDQTSSHSERDMPMGNGTRADGEQDMPRVDATYANSGQRPLPRLVPVGITETSLCKTHAFVSWL